MNERSDAPRTLGFFLIDGFALLSYAAVVEPYRAANMLAGRELYRWAHISVDGGTARASNGATMLADQAVDAPLACETLFVFAGGDPATFGDAGSLAWLRRLARSGATIVGVSAGPYLLATAGLLDGYRATIHWEHRAALAARFPLLAIEPSLYVIDRRRVTCAGGTAGLDLAIELIEREQGHALAAKVSDWFIRTQPRAADMPQRLGLRERCAIGDDRVLKVLARLEASIEAPPERAALAALAGVSVRQLERLFRAELGSTLGDTARRIRLDQADHLLRTTGMPVTAIAFACGFTTSSIFSQTFRRHFGRTPQMQRAHSGGAGQRAAAEPQ